jgi:hypothetical protein
MALMKHPCDENPNLRKVRAHFEVDPPWACSIAFFQILTP